MIDLLTKVRMTQVEAGETAVIKSLRSKGLLLEPKPQVRQLTPSEINLVDALSMGPAWGQSHARYDAKLMFRASQVVLVMKVDVRR